MDRAKLVRAHFDAHRDLTWVEDLEPKLKANGVAGAELQDLRQAWNRHTEENDWAWWKEHVRPYADSHLQDQIQDCIEKMTVLGMSQWRQENKHQSAFHDIVNAADGQRDQQRESGRNGREM